MSSAALIRSQVEARLAGRQVELLPGSGLKQRKTLRIGGATYFGGITEIVGSPLCSTGRKSVQAQLLAQATREQFCALVDATDSFDPRSAQAAGVKLKRLLWVRCGGRGVKTLEQTFKSVDLLLQGSVGFGLIVVDLAGVSERFVRRIPLTTWFRFCRVIEKLSTALVFVTPRPVTGTCASLTLKLSGEQIRWSQAAPECPAHARLSAELELQVEIAARRSFKKPPQPVRCFSAEQRWA